MEGLARSVRLIVGLGMVAAGTTLAAPTALVLAEWARNDRAPPLNPPLPAAADWSPPRSSGPPGAGAGPGGPPPLRAAWPPAPQPDPDGSATPLQTDYQPPAPPAPLPPSAGGLTAPGPDLSVAYRSTLEVPPPPLIDGQRPPPLAVAWTVREGRDVASLRGPVRPPASIYRVRDGDDLTGIANRFYGTPAAAGPIWDANRGRLADPEVLPIGVEIVLPPLAVAGPDGDRSLEPAATVRPDLPSPPTAVDGSPWLGSGS